MRKKIDLTGQKFGRLTVLCEAGRDKSGNVLWECQCDCGNRCSGVIADNLRSGRTKSCGCFKRDRAVETNTKHGKVHHPLYSVWYDMLRRCGVRKGASDKDRRNYIERGITVSEEWRDFQSFYNWASTHGYEKGLQIDRIDNDRGYCPENCRFVTPKQNNRNRRCTRYLPHGEALAMFAERCGLQTRSSNVKTKSYGRIENAFEQYGPDVAIAQVWGEAVALRFAEYGVSLVPFSKLSLLA